MRHRGEFQEIPGARSLCRMESKTSYHVKLDVENCEEEGVVCFRKGRSLIVDYAGYYFTLQ